MYYVRNECEINIILKWVDDKDEPLSLEFSTESLLKISNYCFGNTVNRCSGTWYGCFYCAIIKHVKAVLRFRHFSCKMSKTRSLQTKCDCEFCFSSKLYPKLVLHDHRNDPRPY